MASNDTHQERCEHVAVCLDHWILVFAGEWNEEPWSNHVIWMGNLYTEEWRKHVIPETEDAPPECLGASATLVGADIYIFGGQTAGLTAIRPDYNTLWKLSMHKKPNRHLVWCEIKQQSKEKIPSPRFKHSAWEYSSKLWVFGGTGLSPEGYLNNHGDFSRSLENNQLMCFDPVSEEWTNPECFGHIPGPRKNHVTAVAGDRAWLYGGRNCSSHDEFFQLDLDTLTWAHVFAPENSIWPVGHKHCTLTAITENCLVMHGGFTINFSDFLSHTWIFDVTTMSWREHTVTTKGKIFQKVSHACASSTNNGIVTIIGGILRYRFRQPLKDIKILLAPNSLQHLAIHTIHKNKDVLPWQILPKQLISLLEC